MAIEKLSDLNPIKALTLTEQEINNYVFQTKRIEIDIEKNYDIALVLGCKLYEIMQYRATDAIKLYKQGNIDKIILSGGVGYLSKNRENSEAYVMYQYMLKNGIPKSDLIVEDRSANTLENMKNSVKIIESELGKKCNIVLVTSDFHSKRSKGMLEKITPIDIYSYGVLDGKHDIDTWKHCNFSSKKLIRTEAALLSYYTKAGIIDDKEVKEINKGSR